MTATFCSRRAACARASWTRSSNNWRLGSLVRESWEMRKLTDSSATLRRSSLWNVNRIWRFRMT